MKKRKEMTKEEKEKFNERLDKIVKYVTYIIGGVLALLLVLILFKVI